MDVQGEVLPIAPPPPVEGPASRPGVVVAAGVLLLCVSGLSLVTGVLTLVPLPLVLVSGAPPVLLLIILSISVTFAALTLASGIAGIAVLNRRARAYAFVVSTLTAVIDAAGFIALVALDVAYGHADVTSTQFVTMGALAMPFVLCLMVLGLLSSAPARSPLVPPSEFV